MISPKVDQHICTYFLLAGAAEIDGYGNRLQLDLVSGRFLVNGHPIRRLPEAITEHPTFRRVFPRTVFEVQPAPNARFGSQQNGVSEQLFDSVHRYHEKVQAQYTFGLRNFNADDLPIDKTDVSTNKSRNERSNNTEPILIVIERQSSGLEYQLIPHEWLRGVVPFLLIENHSHWLDIRNWVIEFRKRTFESPEFYNVTYKFCINRELNIGLLLDNTLQSRYFVSLCSGSFKAIQSIFSRFEHSNYTHIILSSKKDHLVSGALPGNNFQESPHSSISPSLSSDNVIILDLPRMGLQFEVEGNRDIVSRQYIGMRLATGQKSIGILVGLQHQLLLEPRWDFSDLENRSIIIPHSSLEMTKKRLLKVII